MSIAPARADAPAAMSTAKARTASGGGSPARGAMAVPRVRSATVVMMGNGFGHVTCMVASRLLSGAKTVILKNRRSPPRVRGSGQGLLRRSRRQETPVLPWAAHSVLATTASKS